MFKIIEINGISVAFDIIELYYEIYIFKKRGNSVATMNSNDIKRFKHLRSFIGVNGYKYVIFTMERGD